MSRQGDPSKEEETKGWKPHQTEVQTFDPRGILQISNMLSREKKAMRQRTFCEKFFHVFEVGQRELIVPFQKVIKSIALFKMRTYSHEEKQILQI